MEEEVISLTWMLAYLSNFFFLSQAGYFAPQARTQPLLHTWSLAIEEQFYLLFAPLMWLCKRYTPKRLPWIILSILACSVGFSIYLTATQQPEAAFFHTFSRIWELMAGCLLVFIPVPKALGWLAHGVLWVCLAAIVASFGWFNPAFTPIMYAPLAIVATGLLVWLGKHQPLSLLQWPPLVKIGKLSYSLYVWHWPLIVLARISPLSPFTKMNTPSLIGLVSLIGAVSYLSWRFLEQPIRQSRVFKSSKALWIAFIVSVLVVLNIAIGLLGLHPQLTLIQAHQQQWMNQINEQNGVQMRRYTEEFNAQHPEQFENLNAICSYENNTPSEEVLRCIHYRFGRQPGPKVLVVGDSFGRDTYYALRQLYPELAIAMVFQPSCVPFSLKPDTPGKPYCFRHLAGNLATLRAHYPDLTIVVSGWWQSHNLAQLLATQGETLYPKRHKPYWFVGVGLTLEPRLPFGVLDGTYYPGNVDDFPVELTRGDARKANALLQPWLQARGDIYVDKWGAFCGPASCQLRDPQTGMFYVYDHAHLSAEGLQHWAAYLKPVLAQHHFPEGVP